MTLETSPESPAPLHRVSAAIGGWISRLGPVWIEAQVTQITRRTGASQVYVQVRDVQQNISMTMVAPTATLQAIVPPLAEGARIVLHAKPEFWTQRGTLVLKAREVRAVGLGDLLARVERLRTQLAGEGLFAADRKRSLPFLPRRIGLICGRDSAAERDVVENAQRRWPAIEFVIRQVVVQGNTASVEVTEALIDLDSLAEVEVIVITRGGGSAEDLLPFSDEALIRAVAACRTPVVSAIGHEQDAPLLDYVADVRASTPTDAARRVVPDLGEQFEALEQMRRRSARAVETKLDREAHRISRFAAHPGLADPTHSIEREASVVENNSNRAKRALANQLQSATDRLVHLQAQLTAMSPAATLNRGYAIVSADGALVRHPGAVSNGDRLEIKVAQGDLHAIVAN